ncbi:MAG: hypothetical protein AB1Z98_03525, partial [Nannocystaceae bacterium]
MSLPQIITVAAFGWLGYRLFGKKKRTPSPGPSSSPTPTLSCGLYRWKPIEVDAALDMALGQGVRDAERLALEVARVVYP